MRQYLDLMRHVLEHGTRKEDRTGTGTLSIFGHQLRFDLARAFRSSRRRSVISSRSSTSFSGFSRATRTSSTSRTTAWGSGTSGPTNGDLGPVYGYQWRSWRTPDGRTIDQISNLIEQSKTKPDSRRLIVSAWNVADVDKMALPPCHALFQFYVSTAGSPASSISAAPIFS